MSFSPGALFPQVSATTFSLFDFPFFHHTFPFVDELCECSRKFRVLEKQKNVAQGDFGKENSAQSSQIDQKSIGDKWTYQKTDKQAKFFQILN